MHDISDRQPLGPDEGEVLEVRGNRIVIRAASADLFVGDYTAAAYFPGPPLHVHPGFDEVFLVRIGRLEMRIGDEVTKLEPGASAHVTGSTPHTFANPNGEPAQFTIVCTPGGWEHYFRALVAGDTKRLAAISERFGYSEVPAGRYTRAAA